MNFVVDNTEAQTINAPDPGFARLDEIAERLNVAPRGESDAAEWCLVGKSGKHYSLARLVESFLDRMDRAAP